MSPSAAEVSKSPSPGPAPRQTYRSLVEHPFPQVHDVNSLHGSVYTTSQVLVQQTAYAVSKSIFSYSPEGFDLDSSVQTWRKYGQPNGLGVIPKLTALESRVGAGSVLLGYTNNHVEQTPTTVLASVGTLRLMQPVLAHFAFKPSSSPLVLNTASVEYDTESGNLASDYLTPIDLAKNLGLGLVSSSGLADAQLASAFSALLASVTPTIHVYDGVKAVRENGKATGVLSAFEIGQKYSALANEVASLGESKLSLVEKVKLLLDRFNSTFETEYKPFEYAGAANPDTVVVAFGSVEGSATAEAATKLAAAGAAVGAINIRLYSPFLEREFFETLPKSTKKIVILGQARNGEDFSALYSEISTSVYMNGFSGIEIVDNKYAIDKSWTVGEIYSVFGKDPVESKASEFAFWDVVSSSSDQVPSTLAHTLSFDNTKAISYIANYDNLTLGGVVQANIRVGESSTPYLPQDASLVFVNSSDILKSYDVLANTTSGVKVVLGGNVDLEKLDDTFKAQASAKSAELYSLDYSAVGDNQETQGRTQSIVQQIAFWRVAFPQLTIDELTTKIVLSNGVDTELVAATVVQLAEKVFETALSKIDIPKEWAEAPVEAKSTLLVPSSFVAENVAAVEETATAESETVVEVAKRIAFQEAYGAEQQLRPDLPVKNFVAKVQVNQRVTPQDYDRHIFHLELDITGTGLTYAIGEALGVHAPNNVARVREFLEWYGADKNEIVTVPSVANDGHVESKTAYQALRDNLDLFGKPPKKFYEGLAEYATDEKEHSVLTQLATPAGAAELKKRTEEDFATYVDILQEFPSAHPSIAELAQLVSPLKRREYSIASSQKVHPNAVHLLIVVVDWVDSQGRKRFGQCSKFLSELHTGAEVIVSVKPSVMKLPPKPEQPVIMAGLGTGLAPFKAFLEEKMWQKQQGHTIGEIYLFLGSRHQKQEYLYGELFEAYKDAGILTYIGAAFSRDQPEKIYIQDRIREASDRLVDAFVNKHGGFYLCGPTWPVPDISAALFDIVSREAVARGETLEMSRVIETLKEEERYILEVY
ncbi:sulfite reductase [NADPH] flavoprotein component [Trichomonascus vanleenenianus]|uniref:sulfite reductase subunit alpha n=1 Tax=Trichomonascus vanleenenianus TaxID=2268995 RepID=UPI003ECB1279